MQKCGGDLEYQANLFELRTREGKEEYSIEDAARNLQKNTLNLLDSIPKCYVHSCGTYQGQDDPDLDIFQNEEQMGKNAFWNEFNIVFPADALMRYTAADHINISTSNKELHTKLYNCLVGLAPVFIYAFSLSPCIHGRLVKVWNRRQQLIHSLGIQSNVCLAGTFPLHSLTQYSKSLEKVISEAQKQLTEKNNFFFTQNNLTPQEIVSEYRGSTWGFYKLFTNQVVRFNQQRGYPEYLEIRCIDAQECVKSTMAITYLIRKIILQLDDLWPLLTHNEDELRYNVHQATLYGNSADILIREKKIDLPTYAQKILDMLLQKDTCEYEALLRQRFQFPPAAIMREQMQKNVDIVQLLSRCLRENKTLKEIV
ncbi:hypothetical protein [Candidatus Uabimicrobium sp. HlEnr_7]|uniref:hypothetical protein n=1 Tax=Candidatus Uabimicrobium helgolandensis TaxID=3095367 RepID=UPI0035589B2D